MGEAMPLIDVNQVTEDLIRAISTPTINTPARSTVPARLPALPGDPVDALQSRTAVRRWAGEALDATLLLRALRYACEQDEQVWKPAFPGLPAPTPALLIQHVGGLPKGYHHYDAERAELVPQRFVPPPVADLVLQLEFAEAPVVILTLGDMAETLARYGAPGHRLMLARGAAFAHAMWLSALSQGGVGTVFAGILTSAARTELGIDGLRQAQLCGLALGKATETPSRAGV